ncbi:hypothetical protein AB0G05_13565 [Nonomuraea wenchangensis]
MEIDLEDAAVARKQAKDAKTKESDRELVARLVDQVRTEGAGRRLQAADRRCRWPARCLHSRACTTL